MRVYVSLLGRVGRFVIEKNVHISKVRSRGQFEVVKGAAFICEEDLSFDDKVHVLGHLALFEDDWFVSTD